MTRPADFLAEVTERRRRDLAASFGDLSPADRERLACCARPPRDFAEALAVGPAVAVIAEVKKASPSAGRIAPDVEAGKQALHYQDGGAAAISVLTEPTSFGGSFGDLSDVADAVDVPVLCKDFVVHEVQPYLARGNGADAVLLIANVLGERLASFVDLVRTLGMEPLVEVVSPKELDAASAAGARVVAVNARDLRTLRVDAAAAEPIVRAAARAGLVTVHASGIRARSDVQRAARAGADAVLVGETLMRAAFPEDVLAELTGVSRGPRCEVATRPNHGRAR